MNPEPQLDWSQIEADYRGGVLSVSAICRVHNVSRATLMDRVASKGWTRDLASQVRIAYAERMMLANDEKIDENDAIQKAAAVMVEVTRSHRKDLTRMREVANMAMDNLAKILGEGVFEEVEVDGKKVQVMRPEAIVLGKTQGVANALDQVASAYRRILDMENQVYGIADVASTILTGNGAAGGAGSDGSGKVAQVSIYIPHNHRDPLPENA